MLSHDIFCESSPHPRPAVSGELARHARGSPVISTVSRESRKTTDKCRSGPQIYPYFGTRSGVPNFHTFFDARFSCEPRRQAESSLDKEALALCHFRAGRYAEAARLYRLVAKVNPDPGAYEIKARLAELRAVA